MPEWLDIIFAHLVAKFGDPINYFDQVNEEQDAYSISIMKSYLDPKLEKKVRRYETYPEGSTKPRRVDEKLYYYVEALYGKSF